MMSLTLLNRGNQILKLLLFTCENVETNKCNVVGQRSEVMCAVSCDRLLELDEAIETLDSAMDYENESITSRKEKLKQMVFASQVSIAYRLYCDLCTDAC